MPVYLVELTRTIEIRLEAPDREDAKRAAYNLAGDSWALRDWDDGDDWEVNVSSPMATLEPDHGVLRGKIVHLDDARDAGTARDKEQLAADIAAAKVKAHDEKRQVKLPLGAAR